MDELPDDVGETAHGWVRLDERSGWGFELQVHFPFPAGNRFRGNAKTTCGLYPGPCEESLQTQNPVSLLGGKLGSVFVGNLVPPEAKKLGHLVGAASEKQVCLRLGESLLKGVAGVSKGSEAHTHGETEKLVRLQDCFHRQLVEVTVPGNELEDPLGERCFSHEGNLES